jgi:hypothetical protein
MIRSIGKSNDNGNGARYLPACNILSRIGERLRVTYKTGTGLDLLTPYSHNSGLKAILCYRYFHTLCSSPLHTH